MRLVQTLLVASAVALASVGCERSYWDPTVKLGEERGHVSDRRLEGETGGTFTGAAVMNEGIAVGPGEKAPKATSSVTRGTGTFVRRITAPSVDTTPGDVTLNFDGTDIREVVKVILGDLLQVNYVLSPQVTGVASLQTGRPLRREHLIPTLETLLRMNGAALLYRGGTYEVVPAANAVQGNLVPQLGDSSKPMPEGYSLQVVPLQYIGAEEMNSILQPLAPEGSVIRVDSLRNLLVIAGTGPEVANMMDTIKVFDVDWMKGLSVGFFVLEYAKAGEVVTQLQGLLTDESGGGGGGGAGGGGGGGVSPFKGLFRFVPVESANAVMVISPKESYIQEARNWIERLDQAGASGSAAERLFVYRVKHGDAENLADIISQVFGGGEGKEKKGKVGGVAPGLGTSTIGSQEVHAINAINQIGSSQSGFGSSQSGFGSSQTGSSFGQGSSGGFGGGIGSSGQGGIGGGMRRGAGATARTFELTSEASIVADATNNSLLIRATPKDYQKILEALKQLDIVPLQVLVEATILEITLGGSLQYGVQWNLYGLATDEHRANFSLNTTSGSSTTAGISPVLPGFNVVAVLRPSTARAILSALANQNLVNVLSSPSVLVMDNQTAKMQVGQQVPVATTQQQGTSTTDRIVNQVEYKDTGVILAVKPRVTPGGMVQMEIEQEVSKVSNTNVSSALSSPTFDTRRISSSVAIRSGQVVVLGGLIQDQRSNTKGGVPGFYNLPFLGPLFSTNNREATRTELVVVLSPKVVASSSDADAVTQDVRRRLKGLDFKF